MEQFALDFAKEQEDEIEGEEQEITHLIQNSKKLHIKEVNLDLYQEATEHSDHDIPYMPSLTKQSAFAPDPASEENVRIMSFSDCYDEVFGAQSAVAPATFIPEHGPIPLVCAYIIAHSVNNHHITGD